MTLVVPSSPSSKWPNATVVPACTQNGPVGRFAVPNAQVEFLDGINITTVAPRQMLKRELVEPIAGLFGLTGQLARLLAVV